MSGSTERKIKKTCPKCGSKDFTIREEFIATREHDVSDGVVFSDGFIMPTDNVVKVTCECSNCGHCWKPRRTGVNKVFFELVKEGGAE